MAGDFQGDGQDPDGDFWGVRQDRLTAWAVLHPRTVCASTALVLAVIFTGWVDAAPTRLVAIVVIVAVGALLSTRWQARSLRGFAIRREAYIDWYRRHPDHEPPAWLRSP